MIIKRLSLSTILILGLTQAIHPGLSNTAVSEAYKGKNGDWQYIELIFIEQPKNKLAAFVQKVRAIAFTVICGSLLSTKITTIKNQTFDASKLTFDLPTISAGILGLISFEALTNYMDASIKHDALVKFLKDWNFHKQYVPTSLIPIFDELAAAFNNSTRKTFSNEEVNAIFEIVQHLIEHEFSKRYEKDKKKDADTLGMFKTITDISKNLAPK